MKRKGGVPYASATSGDRARDEIERMLRYFGCTQTGWATDWETYSVTLAFVYHGRAVQLKASAQGWAALYLNENPWNSQRRTKREEYENAALEQGLVAINSILRDWIKGQLTAIETGIFTFDHIFLPYMLMQDGKTVLENKESLTLKLIEGGQWASPHIRLDEGSPASK